MLKLLNQQLVYISKRKKTSILAKVKGGLGNRNQTHTNTKVMDPNMSYVEGINNIEL